LENKPQTYTYTARSVNDPENVVTFTLDDGHLRVNLTGLFDQASKIGQAEARTAELKQQITTQAKPMAMKLVEEFSGHVHVKDVQASLSDEKLQVALWHRLAGLRLAPVVFNMGKIDNQEAAQAFINELEQRQESESHAGKFFGPLDYWFGWVALILVVGLLIRWPSRKES
jgi:hypothetical protein